MIHLCKQDLSLLQGGLEAGLAVAQLLFDLLALGNVGSQRFSEGVELSGALRHFALQGVLGLLQGGLSLSLSAPHSGFFDAFLHGDGKPGGVALQYVVTQPRLHPFHGDLFAA